MTKAAQARRFFIALSLGTLGGMALPSLVSAQTPGRPSPPTASTAPLRLIVPFTPGTGIDLIARQVGPRLAEKLGRTVVVDNKAGASGNIGTEMVVRAAPDGNTLLVTVNTMVMNRALYPKLGFDAIRDLEPIAMTSWGQLVLVASKQSGIQSAQDLVSRARKKPGALNYGSPGNGTPHHLAMELVKKQARLYVTHIPYRGTGQAVTDLIGGQIDVMFLPIHVALAHVRAGSLKALAISSETASPLMPDAPPLKSLGLGSLQVEMWYGILGPKGLPIEQVERLNQELKTILQSPEIKASFETQGMTPAHSTAAEFGALIARDAKRWEQVIRSQKISAD